MFCAVACSHMLSCCRTFCLTRSPTDNETRMFYEIVVAPGYTPEGLEVLKGKSKALRILEAKPRAPSGRSLRQVAGGWLLQVSCLCVWAGWPWE